MFFECRTLDQHRSSAQASRVLILAAAEPLTPGANSLMRLVRSRSGQYNLQKLRRWGFRVHATGFGFPIAGSTNMADDQQRRGDARAGNVQPARPQAAKPVLPPIALPKGGGSIRGIGEKFAANPVTGSASLSVPIPASPGRAGAPPLALVYDSGGGNGPFGFGWRLSAPSIKRRTEKRLPCYRDNEEVDVFQLSDVEDLVPEADAAGQIVTRTRTVNGREYSVRRYRPRIEGLFARIERWRDNKTGRSHWRSISRDNVTSLYGLRQAANSRISDPADEDLRTFSWFLDTTFDDKGNLTLYDYIAEDGAGVPASLAERNRGANAARYPKRVRHGNRMPYWYYALGSCRT